MRSLLPSPLRNISLLGFCSEEGTIQTTAAGRKQAEEDKSLLKLNLSASEITTNNFQWRYIIIQ